MKLNVFPNFDELASQCLELLRQTFPKLGTHDGIMLAGGKTPLEIYRRAAAENLSTAGKLFLSDERYVPFTDPQSNYRSIAPFFPTLGRVPTELPIEAAAQAFCEYLSRMQSVPLGLLGLGADGHTASLFTLQDAAFRNGRLAVPVIKTEKPDRISVTPVLLRRIEKIIILATGEEKKAIIQTLLENSETIPAGAALAGHPNVEVWTDNRGQALTFAKFAKVKA
ncbi:MAG: hypothetical protein HOO88_02810 [Kiritimatiellaceae bacterium]|nr:hypothetical protein [Kiritimatiellaceae bacterium]